MRVLVTGLSASGKSSLCHEISRGEDRFEHINIGELLMRALDWPPQARDQLSDRTREQILQDHHPLRDQMESKGLFEASEKVFLIDSHVILPYRDENTDGYNHIVLTTDRIHWLYDPDLIIVNTRPPADIYKDRSAGDRDRMIALPNIIQQNQAALVRTCLDYRDRYSSSQAIDDGPIPVMILPGRLPDHVTPAVTMINDAAVELDFIENYQHLHQKPTPPSRVRQEAVLEIL